MTAPAARRIRGIIGSIDLDSLHSDFAEEYPARVRPRSSLKMLVVVSAVDSLLLSSVLIPRTQ